MLNIYLLHNSDISLLDINTQEKEKAFIRIKTPTKLYVAAIFVITQNWKKNTHKHKYNTHI